MAPSSPGGGVTMGRLDGRVAIVTGAGRGLGRCHALFLAGQGAAVVVNDMGGSVFGEGHDSTPAHQVVAEIRAAGGAAIASDHDVADWDAAENLVRLAVTEFGDLHVLVNNAGILRDRTLVNMTEAEWDAVIRVHLKGHAAPTKHAMSYWRERSRTGAEVRASVIHTSSIAAFTGNFGQANYSAAKLGMLALSAVVDLEGARHGVRSNVVAPGARTRLALSVPGAEEDLGTVEEGAVDPLDPAHVSPLVGWLAERDCPAHGQVFHLCGTRLRVLEMPPIVHTLDVGERWTPELLDAELTGKLVEPRGIAAFL